MEIYNWSVNRWELVMDVEQVKKYDLLFTDVWSEHANELLNSEEDELEDNRWELIKDLGHERMFFSPEIHRFISIRRPNEQEVRTSERRTVPKRRTRTQK